MLLEQGTFGKDIERVTKDVSLKNSKLIPWTPKNPILGEPGKLRCRNYGHKNKSRSHSRV